jgi:hypothetical protein
MDDHNVTEVLVSGFDDNSQKLSPDYEEFRLTPASGKLCRKKSLLSEALSSCKSCPSLRRNLASQSSDAEEPINYFQDGEDGDDDEGCGTDFTPEESSKISPTLKGIVTRPIIISKTSRCVLLLLICEYVIERYLLTSVCLRLYVAPSAEIRLIK